MSSSLCPCTTCEGREALIKEFQILPPDDALPIGLLETLLQAHPVTPSLEGSIWSSHLGRVIKSLSWVIEAGLGQPTGEG